MSQTRTSLLLVIISALFVSILGFIYLNITKKPVITRYQPIPTTTPTPSLKTYKNNLYEFQYPSQLKLTENQNRVTLLTPSKNEIYFSTDTDSSPTIAQYLTKIDKVSAHAWENSPSVEIQSTKKTVINDLSCIQRVEIQLAAGTILTKTYFKKGSTIIVATFSPTPGNETSVDEKIYSQIISSLKFVNKPTLVNGSNSDQLVIDTKDYSASFIFNNQKITFDKKPVDYPGKILYSPNNKFACIEYGTSGLWLYNIFDLQKRQTILSGGQYSYCLEWTPLNQIVVKDIPYNDQTNIKVYSIDPETLKKQ